MTTDIEPSFHSVKYGETTSINLCALLPFSLKSHMTVHSHLFTLCWLYVCRRHFDGFPRHRVLCCNIENIFGLHMGTVNYVLVMPDDVDLLP